MAVFFKCSGSLVEDLVKALYESSEIEEFSSILKGDEISVPSSGGLGVTESEKKHLSQIN